MSKKILFIAAASLSLLASCNGDDPVLERTTEVKTLNLASPLDPSLEPEIAPSRYSARLNYTGENITLTLNQLTLNNQKYSFSTPVVKYSYSDQKFTMNFSSPTLYSINGGAGDCSNLMGCVTNAICVPPTLDQGNVVFMNHDVINITYTINDKYMVTTFPADAVYAGQTKATTGAGAEPFVSEEILYRVSIDYSDPTKLKANIYIYNAKFNPNMPVTVNIALKELKVNPGKGYYTITGENIVPVSMGEGTPYPHFTFSNFTLTTLSADLTTAKIEYDIPMEQSTYHGSFVGTYRVQVN